MVSHLNSESFSALNMDKTIGSTTTNNFIAPIIYTRVRRSSEIKEIEPMTGILKTAQLTPDELLNLKMLSLRNYGSRTAVQKTPGNRKYNDYLENIHKNILQNVTPLPVSAITKDIFKKDILVYI